MPHPLFAPAGALLEAYEAVDWAATPLGEPDTWSPALRSTVAILLRTRFPVTLLWGPEFVLVYNEAYVELIGEKHPAALGARTREVFPEAWDQIGPMLEGVLEFGEPVWVENEPLPLVRRGFLEECWFTFSYSPVLGADGRVEGVLDIAAETTRSVISQRRLALLARLGDVLADADSPVRVLADAVRVLRDAAADLEAVDLRPAPLADAVPTDRDDRLPAAPLTPLGRRDLVIEEREGHRVSWLSLTSAGEVDGGPEEERPTLAVRPSAMLPMDDDHESFLRLVGATVGSALDRVEAISRERRTAEAERALSTTLQRSLLSAPIRTERIDVVVRYQPAVDIAQVGGDWHDSFLLAEGTLALAVGDVAGHDSQAAAAMAQIRNLLRGIAIAAPGSPAAVLGALDRALDGLAVIEVATSVFAGIRAVPEGHLLQWSNAGHPPPVLMLPDGEVRLLEGPEPDPLLGLVPGYPRTDHEVLLPDGSMLLLFTDGLVERRTAGLDAGLAWLADWLRDWHDLVGRHGEATATAEALADALLAVVAPTAEDDIALVVVTTAPATQPGQPGQPG